MALKSTSTGFALTSGRGKSAAVVLDISFADIERWARRNRGEMPKLTRRSFGRAASGLKRQLQSVMASGGDPSKGVPPFRHFEWITERIREAKHITSRPMGGVLAEKNRIVAFKRNGWQVVGWPDALAKWAVNFQDALGNNDLDNPRTRYWLHRKGVKEIPHGYIHNERPVMTPFADHVRQHLDEWAKKILDKDIAKLIAKGAAA